MTGMNISQLCTNPDHKPHRFYIGTTPTAPGHFGCDACTREGAGK